MKTRDRILNCALELFNRDGEPNVTTLDIANELGISPGNLYYHFHGKEPLTMQLLERFQADMAPLLDPPLEARLDVEDYWLFLHLIVERMPWARRGRRLARLERSWKRKRYCAMRSTIRCRNSQ